MRIFLSLLCVLCATPVRGDFDGTCLRLDPPTGVLVLYQGSKLVLTCSGHVTVDGVKVRNSSNTSRRGSSSDVIPNTVNIINSTAMKSDKHTVENAVSQGYHTDPTVTGENRSLGHTDTGYTTSPATHMLQPTSARKPLETEEIEDDYKEEVEEEGSRVTRGTKFKSLWTLNGRTLRKGDSNQGEITFERSGGTLSLSSVRLTDSGKYSCYYKGKERFSVKVTVADPLEKPNLYCYKRSPSSKIRCEWTPQKPITIRPNCYLFLSKSPTKQFQRLQCSYSSRASRCWCALTHNEDELRLTHFAYLCVTSIAGSATSNRLTFRPLAILKPDPPTNVSVRNEEGQETRMKVTWSLPTSWKSQDNFYQLHYELKYRPLMSSSDHTQMQIIKHRQSYFITDAMPGVEYVIQIRAKEEYDGLWSEWSKPVYASSWKAPTSTITTIPVYVDSENSGTDDYVTDDPPTFTVVSTEPVISPVVLWICSSFALLSVILATYIFRHKDKFMSKLQNLSVITLCGGSPRPPAPASAAPEGQALVTFGPSHYKEPPQREGEEGEEGENEECMDQRTEAMHFNNISYFFLQQSS